MALSLIGFGCIGEIGIGVAVIPTAIVVTSVVAGSAIAIGAWYGLYRMVIAQHNSPHSIDLD